MDSNTTGQDSEVPIMAEQEEVERLINPDANAFIEETIIPVALFAVAAILMFLVYRFITN